MRVGRLAVTIVLVLLSAGCSKLSLTPAATLDAPRFELTPDRGDGSTVFHVDAGDLGKFDVLWDFGDGILASGPSADHKYGFSNGVMTITMLVRDDATGKQSIATRTVTLGGGVNLQPSVSVDASPSWAEVGKTVTLTAFASDGDHDPLSYLWTVTKLDDAAAKKDLVVDGKTADNTISFDAPGAYEVKARVRDPKGAEATSTARVDVSRHIPARVFDAKYNGTLVAGSGGQNATASEQLWVLPSQVPDSNVDAARYPFALKYPASTIVILTWNDTTTQGFYDLDLELRNTDTNKTVFTSAHHANPGPPPTGTAPFEFNFTTQEPGHYEAIVRATAGAKIDYVLWIHSNLYVTPEMVNAAEP